MVETIINNITELCKLRGITIHTLCTDVGVSDSYFKRNRTDFPLSLMLKLADYFNVDAQNLWNAGFTQEIQKDALKAEIERLNRALEELENPIMAKPE